MSGLVSTPDLAQRIRQLADDCWNPTNEALLRDAADRLDELVISPDLEQWWWDTHGV